MDTHSEKTDVQVLFEKWQAGDEHAFNRLFEINLAGWLVTASFKLKNAGVEHLARPSDLVQGAALRMRPYLQEKRAYFRDALHFQRVFRKQVMHQLTVVHHLAPGRNETQLACELAGRPGGSSHSQWQPSDHKNDPTRNSIIDHLDEAISLLPEKEQQALHLYYHDGLTEVEVAAEMGCSERWVRELLTRAGTFLKKWFADYRHPATNGVPKGYRHEKPLGSGGCGEVWEVTGSPKGRTAIRIAPVKIARYEVPGHPGIPYSTSDNGWRLIINLQHPNIVDVYQIVVLAQHGINVVEMELVQRNLKEVLKDEGPIPLDVLLGYMRDAACAIDALTKRSIIHRDIKPENLGLLNGRVKLLDFGFARRVWEWLPNDPWLIWEKLGWQKEPPDVDAQGMTKEFAPPEFFDKQVAKTSDQYSLGKTYLELRTGRPASMWTKKSKNPKGLKQLSPPEQAIVRRCLHTDPEQRWPDCCTFVRELAWVSRATLPDALLKKIASEPEDAKDPGVPLVHFNGDKGQYTSNEDLLEYSKRVGMKPDVHGGLPSEWQ